MNHTYALEDSGRDNDKELPTSSNKIETENKAKALMDKSSGITRGGHALTAFSTKEEDE